MARRVDAGPGRGPYAWWPMVERALAAPAAEPSRSRYESGAVDVPRAGVLSPLQPFKELLLLGGTSFVQIGGTVMAAQNQPEYGSLGFGAGLLLAVGVLALPLRHRFPLLTLLLTFTATLSYWSLDNPGGPVFLSLIIAVVHMVLIGRRWAAISVVAAGFALFPWLGYLAGHGDRPSWSALVGLAAWLVALVAVSEVVRIRRDRIAEAARSAAEAMRRQAADERVRIARDLHDSVAHNMSLISIHAGVALHLLEAETTGRGDRGAQGQEGGAGGDDGTPSSEVAAQVRTSLATIKEASREALVELRSVLGVLRHVDEVDEADDGGRAIGGDGDAGRAADPDPAGSNDQEGRSNAAPRAPVPGLERLDSLLERAGSVGLDVQLDVAHGEGAVADLPRPVDVAAFRIIQESLTNVSRHSDSPTALVKIRRGDGMLTVDVLDEGSGRPPAATDLPGGGNGIIGMRERAAAVGGRLRAGPRPGQGFAVHAELPLDPSRHATTGGTT